MKVHNIDSKQVCSKGYVSTKTTQTIKNIQKKCAKEMKFWGGGDFEAHIAIYKGYEELNELMQKILVNLTEKMQYFAKDCVLKLNPTKATIIHPKSKYKLTVAKYDKELKDELKLELTEKALKEIHPGYANENFCMFRKDNVPERIFNAEFYDIG